MPACTRRGPATHLGVSSNQTQRGELGQNHLSKGLNSLGRRSLKVRRFQAEATGFVGKVLG